MATTKPLTVLDNDVALVASAGAEAHTSGLATLTGGYGALLYLKLTNGATGPTAAAACQIYVSPDNTNWYKHVPWSPGITANNATDSTVVKIDIGVKYLVVKSGSNTGQNVTIRAEIVEITDLNA